MMSNQGVSFLIMVLISYTAWESVAQEIVLEVIEPDPIVQQSLCTNRQVIYECRILVGSTGLTWTLPTSDTLGFSVASQVGNTRSSSDDKFSATLTRKTEDDGTDDFLLTSTLQIQPPLDSLNGQSLRCAGGTVENPVDVSTTITAITASTPGSPSVVRQDPSVNTESSAVIRWSAPTSSGGEGVPIMSYVVTANGENQTVIGANNAYTISGLEYNTNYSVLVTAVNSCGLQSEAASVRVYIEAKEPPRPMLLSADLYCDTPLDDGRPVVIHWRNGEEEEGVVYPGGNDATVTLDSGDVTCAVTATSCTAVITRDDVYTVSLTVSNDVGSAPPVTKMFDLRPVVVEVMIDTSDQFGVSVSLRDACLTDRNHTVFVFFGTMDVSGSSGACSLKQKMAGTISAGVSQMFFANTCSLSLGPDERYCVVATLEGDDGNLIVSAEKESDAFWSTITIAAATAAAAVLISLPAGVVIGLCVGRCVWRRGHGRTTDKVIYEEPSLIAVEDNTAYNSQKKPGSNIPLEDNKAYNTCNPLIINL